MGLSIIEQVIETLRAAGFPTQRAMPGTEVPAITRIVAAVQLAQADVDKRETVLDVHLLSPLSMGAQACEDAAFVAAEALKDIDISCVIGSVSFDGRAGIFSITCRATKPETVRMYLDVPFKIGAVNQSRVVSFTAQQQVSEATTPLKDAPWTLRLEQFFRNGFGEDKNPDGDTFTVTHGDEVYHGCRWISCKRTREVDGLRQIREGIATNQTML